MKIIPVIISGGSGTRLWPLSREDFPKQYLSLTGNNSMLQETILRLNGLQNLLDPIIVCNTDHRFIVAEQCKQIGIQNPTILLEPTRRNTAPAIAAAALQSLKSIDDAVLLVLSADHLIQDTKAFHKAIDVASKQALGGALTTFGILPTEANTGYGYIKVSEESLNGAHIVKEFIEKPDLETAKTFLKQGNYLWNSGMFMFKARVLINELTLYAPDIIASITKAVDNAVQDLDFIRLDKQAFESSPGNSIDFALMEKSQNVVVVLLDAKWSDIGSWSALYDMGPKDINGNVIRGDVFSDGVSGSYINADHHMVVAIGVDNLIIVDTPDVTLIARKDKSQEVKTIVESLNIIKRNECKSHRKTYRPWGWYDSIDVGENYQVKRLCVNSGGKLSLQMHHKRAEHWVVILGTATVINGKEKLTLIEGDSIYIPIGSIHSLENNTNEQLEIIEVQSGVYISEDDIVRFKDIYGRMKEC